MGRRRALGRFRLPPHPEKPAGGDIASQGLTVPFAHSVLDRLRASLRHVRSRLCLASGVPGKSKPWPLLSVTPKTFREGLEGVLGVACRIMGVCVHLFLTPGSRRPSQPPISIDAEALGSACCVMSLETARGSCPEALGLGVTLEVTPGGPHDCPAGSVIWGKNVGLPVRELFFTPNSRTT